MDDHLESADLIIVPASTVYPNGQLSWWVEGRVQAALQVYHANYAQRIFVSGGVGIEGVDEAAAMKRYLVAYGVPESAVITDNLGVNTQATGFNAVRFMRQNSYRRALVVTQFFHVPRTTLWVNFYGQNNGITVVGTAHSQQWGVRDIYSLLREVAAMVVFYCGF